MSDYFEQMIYDDGTYQVWQCQTRGNEPYLELHKPVKLFGKRFKYRLHTLITWFGTSEGEQQMLKSKLKQLKEFPSPAVKFELDD